MRSQTNTYNDRSKLKNIIVGRFLRRSAPILVALLGFALGGALPAPASADTLAGSRASMNRQSSQARAHDFTYLRTTRDVRRFVDLGLLVRVAGNRDYDLHNVSFPYARPAVRTFIERLASQYRAACGEVLVVTSLTRPRLLQPGNASPNSVHPTGMALDLRRSNSWRCRQWLERVLVSLERSGVLEATQEHHPPHYHVAVFPSPYRQYVGGLTASRAAAPAYRVRRGDTLWRIARRHGTSVQELKAANRLASSEIHPGQVLHVPTR